MFEIGHFRDPEGYRASWYDKENDGRISLFYDEFYITPAEKDGDIYITVETYYPSMVPNRCNLGLQPFLTYQIYKETTESQMIFESVFDM